MYYGEFGHKKTDDGGGETRDYIQIFIITDCIKNNLFPKQVKRVLMGFIVNRDCTISATESREKSKNFTVKREKNPNTV